MNISPDVRAKDETECADCKKNVTGEICILCSIKDLNISVDFRNGEAPDKEVDNVSRTFQELQARLAKPVRKADFIKFNIFADPKKEKAQVEEVKNVYTATQPLQEPVEPPIRRFSFGK